MENGFRYGSVLKLTRYDTVDDVEKNFALMKECGMDTVVIWPAAFWWEEKTERYPFDTGIKILEAAERIGIKVIMELAGQLSVFEYIPDFLMKKEYYPCDLNGSREMGQSSFGFLSYFHPEVNSLICEHFKAAARAYRDMPALLGYDVFNETMFRSFDKYTMAEFRVWLKEKYGTLGRLNEVWERTYGEWEQIEFESWKWMSIMPEVDYGQFRKAAVGRFLKKWCEAIKTEDSEHILIADNIHSQVAPGCNYERPQDDFDLKNTVEEIGMSFYPKQVNGTMENALRWEIFDGFYAASKREGFYISEMQTHIQALFNPTTCVRPYELKRWCLEAYAGGAKGLIYWMWRPFDKGLQTLGRGLVDYKGRRTERFEMAKELSATFEKYGTVAPVSSKIGILFDPICDDFQRIITKSYSVDSNIYLASVYGAYKAMLDAGTKADIITLSEIENYKAVVLTNHIVVGSETAAKLKRYTENGGILIIDGRFGIVDETSLLNKELPGGEMNELCGMDYLDSDYEGLKFSYGALEVNGYYGRELVELTGGEPVGTFEDGRAAAVRVRYGKGEAVTFNSYLWYGYSKTGDGSIKDLAKTIICDYGLDQTAVEGDVLVRVSEAKDRYIAFVFNYTNEKQNATVTLELGEKKHSFEISVEANDSVTVEIEK